MAAIIFDFDGTIADSFDTVVQIFHDLTGRHDAVTEAEEQRLRGMSLRQAAKELGVHIWKMPFLVIRGRRRMAGRLEKVHMFEGMPGILNKLYNEGHELFIVSSNSETNIHDFLARHSLLNEFVGIYGNVRLHGKARVLRKVLKQNNLEPRNTWYVGDEVRDIQGAKRAGLKIASVSWGYNTSEILREHKPTKLLASPADLFSLLEEV